MLGRKFPVLRGQAAYSGCKVTIWEGAPASVRNTLEERVVDASFFFFFFNANYVFLLVDAILIYLKISEAIESDKKFVAVAFPMQQLAFLGSFDRRVDRSSGSSEK